MTDLVFEDLTKMQKDQACLMLPDYKTKELYQTLTNCVDGYPWLYLLNIVPASKKESLIQTWLQFMIKIPVLDFHSNDLLYKYDRFNKSLVAIKKRLDLTFGENNDEYHYLLLELKSKILIADQNQLFNQMGGYFMERIFMKYSNI